jgi:carboxymethylenebutenolidase
MPETDVARLRTLKCDVLGIFGQKDQFINAQVVSQFKNDMNAAGKTLTVYEYNADHAFANPSNPSFDKQASAESRKKVLQYLRNKFGIKEVK